MRHEPYHASRVAFRAIGLLTSRYSSTIGALPKRCRACVIADSVLICTSYGQIHLAPSSSRRRTSRHPALTNSPSAMT
jgi:hypothetical protein